MAKNYITSIDLEKHQCAAPRQIERHAENCSMEELEGHDSIDLGSCE